MDVRDHSVRRELAADGSLFEGYHPRMEEVHRSNAARLSEIIEEFGWPGHILVGEEGAEAAWRIAQHSIGEPSFMRRCRELLDKACASGDAPRWQFAFIDDRIRVFEGIPQKYGTQLRGGKDGLEPFTLEDESRVEGWRGEIGLPSLAEIIAESRANPPPKPQNQEAKDLAEIEWRRSVGWISK
jgi:hypothetical protein